MTNRLISFFLFVLLIFPSCSKQDSKNIAQNELQQFYCCSTVDWAKLDTLYYRPYNCDWPDDVGMDLLERLEQVIPDAESWGSAEKNILKESCS